MNNLIGTKVPYSEKLIFIDVETANIDNEICQIGAIIVEDGEVVSIVDEYVKPLGEFNDPAHHEHIHHISAETVKGSKNLLEIWNEKFSFYNKDYIFVAHCAPTADCNWLQNNLAKFGLIISPMQYYDTCYLARKIITKKEIESKLSIQKELYTRENLCRYLELTTLNSHNAFSDALACFNIFNYLHNITVQKTKFVTGYKHYRNENALSHIDKEEIKRLEHLTKKLDELRRDITFYFDDLAECEEEIDTVDTEEVLECFNSFAQDLGGEYIALHQQINSVLDDGVITEEERIKTFELMESVRKDVQIKLRELKSA